VTAFAEESQASNALDAGADAYVRKPFSPKELLAKTASLLLERRPRSRFATG
jgi:DNA-binding response OmpR family regulator